jgi:hypothetical protein
VWVLEKVKGKNNWVICKQTECAMGLNGTGYEDVELIHVAQDKSYGNEAPGSTTIIFLIMTASWSSWSSTRVIRWGK